jgi:hypothetical protein
MSNDKPSLEIATVGQSDADFAAELKTDARVPLEVFAKLMERGLKRGIRLDFAIAADNFGRMVIQNITATKAL